MKYLLLTEKNWHQPLFEDLKTIHDEHQWVLIDSISDFTFDNLQNLKPDKVFIPHWSHIISSKIYKTFECIVFHMTDLPFGRGGSPLQNLISRRYDSTKISALKVNKGIDTGDIYLKKDLSLLGTAEEILIRASKVIYEMINEIIFNNIEPISQNGKGEEFKRRKPDQSCIADLKSIQEIFNYIRMLDAEGYPHAYLDHGDFRFEFSRASLKFGEIILSDVRIIKR